MNPKQKWVLESGVFFPIPGDTTLHNTILIEPDDLGFFTIKRNYSETTELACVINYRSAPSLYQGEI